MSSKKNETNETVLRTQTFEKDAYVNRCIDYLVEYGDKYEEFLFFQLSKYDFKFFKIKIEFTNEYLRNNLTDDEIITFSHLIHMIYLYSEFEYENNDFYIDIDMDDRERVFFSYVGGCHQMQQECDSPNRSDWNWDSDDDDGDPHFCCGKRYVYMLGYLSDIIVYNSDFNIDTKIDSVLLTRIN
jgi:hypothetical protein